jgi:hypothetical protein
MKKKERDNHGNKEKESGVFGRRRGIESVSRSCPKP